MQHIIPQVLYLLSDSPLDILLHLLVYSPQLCRILWLRTYMLCLLP
uniref:Uncharacterized protein n=1 Tax=Arundo donax TaxID=35708 RepID=A0A0A9GR88_ARUDO